MTEYRRGRGPHFAAIPWKLQDDPRSTAYHIATYAALKRFADFGSPDGAHPSDATAARLAGCSERKLMTCRKDLRAWGWIDWDSGAAAGTTNAYVIHASLEETDTSAVQEPPHDVRGGSAHGAEGGTHTVRTTKSPIPRAHTEGPPKAPQPGLFGAVEANGSDPALWMHSGWEKEFGNGHPIALTDGRRQKYRAMYGEQLSASPDPVLAWRVVLKAVKASPHHMGRRTYQMPESLLLNPERRDRWVQEAVELVEATRKKSTEAADFAAAYRRRQQERGR